MALRRGSREFMEPFPYSAADYEEIDCNLCGSHDGHAVGTRDRNGLAVRTVLCKRCGLIYLSPRMTPAWYAKYYEIEYRRQMAAFLGRETHGTLLARQNQQRGHARFLTEYLRHAGVNTRKRILEIGSSTGGVLAGLGQAFHADIVGVEPSSIEAEFATSRNIPTKVGLFEEISFTSADRFDLIVCTQSFNHLLDPRGTTSKIANLLGKDGLFLLECMDFLQLCRFWGERERAIQIDHTYMFVQETLVAMLSVCGLEVLPGSVQSDDRLSGMELRRKRRAHAPSLHVRMLARRAPAGHVPVLSSGAEVFRQLESLPNRPGMRRLARWWELQLMRRDRAMEFATAKLGISTKKAG
ncbi:MAG: class I SAM-dependent methyltransferase [Planctomycetota bacterium]